MNRNRLKNAILSVHSCPLGELGTKDTGGMSVYIREIARQLGLKGHHVDIFTRCHGPGHARVVSLAENVRLIHLKAGSNGMPSKLALYAHLAQFTAEIDEFGRREQMEYDLIHSHYWLSGLVGLRLQAVWGVPHVVMFHTLGAVKNKMGAVKDEPGLRIEAEREVIRGCHGIIAATERERNELVEHYQARPEIISVVPCGVNLDLFQVGDKASARRQIGLDEKDKVILYVGRIDPLKGLDRLIRTVGYLKEKRNLKLVLVGGDDQPLAEMKRLQRTARELGLEKMITFVGRVDQLKLPAYYNAADVFALPSYHESFGLVTLESLACGTPVVATNVGGLSEFIRPGRTGYLIENNVPRAMASKISILTSKNPNGIASPEAIRTSVVGYEWSSVAGAIVQEYQSVLEVWSA